MYLQSPDEGLWMLLVVVVPHPGRPVARGREHQVVRYQDPKVTTRFTVKKIRARLRELANSILAECKRHSLVDFPSVPLVDEVALAGGDVPLADGGVGRARVHVDVVEGGARYVVCVAPGLIMWDEENNIL